MRLNYTHKRSYRDDHSQEVASKETVKRVAKVEAKKAATKVKKKPSVLNKVLNFFK
jgi:hypothetical protein